MPLKIKTPPEVRVGTAILQAANEKALFLNIPFAYGNTRQYRSIRVYRRGTPAAPGKAWEVRVDGHVCHIIGRFILMDAKLGEVWRSAYEWKVECVTVRDARKAVTEMHRHNVNL